MARSIEISTEVFAKIWSHRAEGEEDENAILTRLLGLNVSAPIEGKGKIKTQRLVIPGTKTLWKHDVRAALKACGGEAHLREIYEKVRHIRIEQQRSVPLNLQAIVRRELEYNSSDSNVFTGNHDWFRSVGGLGKGVWALRKSDLGDG